MMRRRLIILYAECQCQLLYGVISLSHFYVPGKPQQIKLLVYCTNKLGQYRRESAKYDVESEI